MSFIRYKKLGKQEYAYKVTAYWDKERKKPRQRVKYLGTVIDKEKGVIEKKMKKGKEKLILDFGDVYVLEEFMKKEGLINLIGDVFVDRWVDILTIISYRICNNISMRYCYDWYEGNIVRYLFKGARVSSQQISELLVEIGQESIQREFFKKYIEKVGGRGEEGIIIDTTGLPNQINMDINEWGYTDGKIEEEIKFLFVVDKGKGLPLFFRYLPGNIVDVSSLDRTIEEMKKYGIKGGFVLIDAGFYSEDNIKGLYSAKIDFLTRLPAGRKLYKDLIRKYGGKIEKFKNVVKYGERVLFIEEKKVEMFGQKGYGYIILDPEKKGRETRKYLLNTLGEEKQEEDIEFELKKKGIIILVSSFQIKKEEVMNYYYLRQRVEYLFRIIKDDLKLIPLRVHKEEGLRGYLLLMFITLVVYALLKERIAGKYTVEEVLLKMRNLKCKIYEDEIIISEQTKQQKEITETLNIIMPKNMGI